MCTLLHYLRLLYIVLKVSTKQNYQIENNCTLITCKVRFLSFLTFSSVINSLVLCMFFFKKSVHLNFSANSLTLKPIKLIPLQSYKAQIFFFKSYHNLLLLRERLMLFQHYDYGHFKQLYHQQNAQT